MTRPVPRSSVLASAQSQSIDLPPATTPPWRSALGPLSLLSDRYSQLTKDHYFACAITQAGFLTSCADVITQTMEGAAGGLDLAHVAAMATVASSMSGGANAVWLRQLEDAFPGKGTQAVATKSTMLRHFEPTHRLHSQTLAPPWAGDHARSVDDPMCAQLCCTASWSQASSTAPTCSAYRFSPNVTRTALRRLSTRLR